MSALSNAISLYKKALKDAKEGDKGAPEIDGKSHLEVRSEPESTPEDEEEFGSPDDLIAALTRELELAQEEIQQLRAIVDSISSDDPRQKLIQKEEELSRLRGLIELESIQKNEAIKQAKYYANFIGKLRRALNVDTNVAALRAVLDLLEGRAPTAG